MKISIFWFRRDLRLNDNIGLNRALGNRYSVLPVFIFDENITEELPSDDARISFIHEQLLSLSGELSKHGSSLLVLQGDPVKIWDKLIGSFEIAEVYANSDYEPYAVERDDKVKDLLKQKGIDFNTFRDQVIFEKNELVTGEGKPYTIFTPYKKKWTETLRKNPDRLHTEEATSFSNLFKCSYTVPSLKESGFSESRIRVRPYDLSVINGYGRFRDFPALDMTSHLGPHLRFGTVSIRKIVNEAQQDETFLGELIWREFFMQVLWNFPHVVTANFNSKFNGVVWRNNEDEFSKWCEGKTGYPLVDAGMRELNTTGYMHNRVRMITAGFLCKHLLTDWRWGEAYFAEKLLDYELSSNNGNWQWASGTGCDAAQYFRVFSPALQLERFDKKHEYVKKWIPELGTNDYPAPVVEHDFARRRAVSSYKSNMPPLRD